MRRQRVAILLSRDRLSGGRLPADSGMGTMLFISVALPLALILIGITLDVQRLYSDRENDQLLADQAAILGGQYLPYPDAAIRAVNRFLDEHDVEQDRRSVTSDGQVISVSFERSTQLIFGTFLLDMYRLAESESSSSDLSYAVTATATANARDLVIFFDMSSYLAPSPGATAEMAFGEELWPTARLFRSGRLSMTYNQQPVDPKIATEQCFNPASTAIKEAVLRLYDYVAAFRLNAVGVISGPGSELQGGGVENVSLVSELSSGNTQHGVGFGVFGYYDRAEAKDEYCLAIAERDRFLGYHVPERSVALQGASLPGRTDGEMLTNDRFRLPADRSSLVSVREAVWSRAVRNQDVNIRGVLQRVESMLFGGAYHPERKGLSYGLTKSAVLLMGDVPHQNNTLWANDRANPAFIETRDGLKQLAATAKADKTTIHLLYVFMAHDGILTRWGCEPRNDWMHQPLNCLEFFEMSQEFETFLKNQETKYLKITMLRAPDTASLAQDLLMALPMVDKSVVLVH